MSSVGTEREGAFLLAICSGPTVSFTCPSVIKLPVVVFSIQRAWVWHICSRQVDSYSVSLGWHSASTSYGPEPLAKIFLCYTCLREQKLCWNTE